MGYWIQIRAPGLFACCQRGWVDQRPSYTMTRRWMVAIRWGSVDLRGVSDAPEKRYGVEGLCMGRHSGLLELEFPGQHHPGGIVVKMVYAQSVYPVDIVGTSLFLINRLLLVAWSLCLCVSGRTGVLPLNHQVLLQRCSWGSASLWHHKVRPNLYDCHILFCSTILSSPVSGLNYKDYSCLIHCKKKLCVDVCCIFAEGTLLITWQLG